VALFLPLVSFNPQTDPTGNGGPAENY